jgi:hypothetical protein
MRLELLIDLLRDGGMLRIGEWDANGSLFCFKKTRRFTCNYNPGFTFCFHEIQYQRVKFTRF